MGVSAAKQDLYELTLPEMAAFTRELGGRPAHAERLLAGLHRKGVRSLAGVDWPEGLRARLGERAEIAPLPVAAEERSSDGFTRKYLLGLGDGRAVETVLMRFKGRATACVSSQVGCAMGCVFCATGQMGFGRHLRAGEIVSQVYHVASEANRLGLEPLRNVVLMGMGEPLHNYDAVMRAAEILRHERGMALAGRRITLSTVGIVPGIIRLAEEARPVSLAVSLHGASDEERGRLVPVARRWPLAELMEACRYYCGKLGRKIFFEWTLIDGENDSAEQARRLGLLLAGMPAHVNLIPLNPTVNYAGAASEGATVRRFQDVLAGLGVPSTVRQRRGIDIAAGCGQLAAAGAADQAKPLM